MAVRGFPTELPGGGERRVIETAKALEAISRNEFNINVSEEHKSIFSRLIAGR
jgi:hypothetical protein